MDNGGISKGLILFGKSPAWCIRHIMLLEKRDFCAGGEVNRLIVRFSPKKKNNTARVILGVLFIVAGILLIIIWVPLWMWVLLLGGVMIAIGVILLRK